MIKKLFGLISQKNNKVGPKKKMIYFILESKETGDIWTDSRDFNEMQLSFNKEGWTKEGWTYEEVMGANGRILLETISKSEFESALKMLKPVPLGFKVEESLKKSLEKIAQAKQMALIDVTTEAIREYVNKNKDLID